MSVHLLAPLLSLLFACSGGASSDGDNDDGSGTDDTGSPIDDGPQPAPLAELSSGQCPELAASHTSTFDSSGEERKVTVVVPAGGTDNSAVVFFFHGLLDPGSTPDPTSYMATGLNLQSVADDLNVVFVLPESPVQEYFGYTFYMWDVWEETDHDVVLYDDLRTCVATELDVDLKRMHAAGFSGGALFVTLIARDRGDTIASMVEMSGGSDVENSLLPGTISAYDTPAYQMPALLMSGGTTDAWPGGGLELVNFELATDSLEDHLAEDGHYVVRCRHEQGHTVTNASWSDTQTWLESHTYGEPSPFEEDEDHVDDLVGDCEVVSSD